MHGLETAADGRVAFALRDEPAWHNLADHIFGEDEHVTTDQMLTAAHLDNWNVRLVDARDYTPDEWGYNADAYFVLRTNPFTGGTDVLSIVGGRYKVLQNEELFKFGDEILHGGASWETAGSIKNGRVVFGSLVIPREFTLDPQGANDTTRTFLLVNTSHDGSLAVQASVTPTRVVCQNTLNIALAGVSQSFKIRHTATVGGKVQAARETLNLTYSYMDKFEAEAKALFEQAVTDKQFNDLIVGLYPKPEKDTKGAVTKWENKVDLINDLYFKSPTNENVKGTAWGAFNALTERLDWYRKPRAGKSENMFAAASGFDPLINAEKGKILTAVKTLVNV